MTYRITTAIGIFIIFIAGYFLFAMKREVENLNFELSAVKKQINYEKDTINLLKAEFSYLSSPARLKKLVTSHLKLASVSPDRMVKDPLKAEVQLALQEKIPAVEGGLQVSVHKSPIVLASSKSSVKQWRYKQNKHKPNNKFAVKTVAMRE